MYVMHGEDMCDTIIMDRLWELKKVGVNFIIVGHTKRKEREDPVTGETYVSITANMGDRHFNKIKTKLHFNAVAFIDRDIVREKTGKKNIVTNEEKIIGKIVGESRKIVFRDDNYSIDSKSRFAEITDDKLDFDETIFYDAIFDAIKKEQSKSGKSFETSQKEQENEKLNRLKEIKTKENELREKKEFDTINKEINEIALKNKSDSNFATFFNESVKGIGFNKFSEIKTLDEAKKLLKVLKSYK